MQCFAFGMRNHLYAGLLWVTVQKACYLGRYQKVIVLCDVVYNHRHRQGGTCPPEPDTPEIYWLIVPLWQPGLSTNKGHQ